MTKSQLIDLIAGKAPQVPRREVEAIVNAVFDAMVAALADGERIEIRGFGSFVVKLRRAREGRNPKTGVKVQIPERRTLSFTVGKELRDRLNPGLVGMVEPGEAADEVEESSERPAAVGTVGEGAEALAAAPPAGTRYTAN